MCVCVCVCQRQSFPNTHTHTERLKFSSISILGNCTTSIPLYKHRRTSDSHSFTSQVSLSSPPLLSCQLLKGIIITLLNGQLQGYLPSYARTSLSLTRDNQSYVCITDLTKFSMLTPKLSETKKLTHTLRMVKSLNASKWTWDLLVRSVILTFSSTGCECGPH